MVHVLGWGHRFILVTHEPLVADNDNVRAFLRSVANQLVQQPFVVWEQVILSTDPSKWGGLAGSTFAVVFRASFALFAAVCAALIGWPWVYSLAAAYRLSYSAINNIIEKLESAAEDEYWGEEVDDNLELLDEVGVKIHRLQNELLGPLSTGWAPTLTFNIA
eukprot:COSAG04_NODE_7822_length_1062_cov_0.832814_2_plen_161_part_01